MADSFRVMLSPAQDPAQCRPNLKSIMKEREDLEMRQKLPYVKENTLWIIEHNVHLIISSFSNPTKEQMQKCLEKVGALPEHMLEKAEKVHQLHIPSYLRPSSKDYWRYRFDNPVDAGAEYRRRRPSVSFGDVRLRFVMGYESDEDEESDVRTHDTGSSKVRDMDGNSFDVSVPASERSSPETCVDLNSCDHRQVTSPSFSEEFKRIVECLADGPEPLPGQVERMNEEILAELLKSGSALEDTENGIGWEVDSREPHEATRVDTVVHSNVHDENGADISDEEGNRFVSPLIAELDRVEKGGGSAAEESEEIDYSEMNAVFKENACDVALARLPRAALNEDFSELSRESSVDQGRNTASMEPHEAESEFARFFVDDKPVDTEAFLKLCKDRRDRMAERMIESWHESVEECDTDYETSVSSDEDVDVLSVCDEEEQRAGRKGADGRDAEGDGSRDAEGVPADRASQNSIVVYSVADSPSAPEQDDDIIITHETVSSTPAAISSARPKATLPQEEDRASSPILTFADLFAVKQKTSSVAAKFKDIFANISKMPGKDSFIRKFPDDSTIRGRKRCRDVDDLLYSFTPTTPSEAIHTETLTHIQSFSSPTKSSQVRAVIPDTSNALITSARRSSQEKLNMVDVTPTSTTSAQARFRRQRIATSKRVEARVNEKEERLPLGSSSASPSNGTPSFKRHRIEDEEEQEPVTVIDLADVNQRVPPLNEVIGEELPPQLVSFSTSIVDASHDLTFPENFLDDSPAPLSPHHEDDEGNDENMPSNIFLRSLTAEQLAGKQAGFADNWNEAKEAVARACFNVYAFSLRKRFSAMKESGDSPKNPTPESDDLSPSSTQREEDTELTEVRVIFENLTVMTEEERALEELEREADEREQSQAVEDEDEEDGEEAEDADRSLPIKTACPAEQEEEEDYTWAEQAWAGYDDSGYVMAEFNLEEEEDGEREGDGQRDERTPAEKEKGTGGLDLDVTESEMHRDVGEDEVTLAAAKYSERTTEGAVREEENGTVEGGQEKSREEIREEAVAPANQTTPRGRGRPTKKHLLTSDNKNAVSATEVPIAVEAHVEVESQKETGKGVRMTTRRTKPGETTTGQQTDRITRRSTRERKSVSEAAPLRATPRMRSKRSQLRNSRGNAKLDESTAAEPIEEESQTPGARRSKRRREMAETAEKQTERKKRQTRRGGASGRNGPLSPPPHPLSIEEPEELADPLSPNRLGYSCSPSITVSDDEATDGSVMFIQEAFRELSEEGDLDLSAERMAGQVDEIKIEPKPEPEDDSMPATPHGSGVECAIELYGDSDIEILEPEHEQSTLAPRTASPGFFATTRCSELLWRQLIGRVQEEVGASQRKTRQFIDFVLNRVPANRYSEIFGHVELVEYKGFHRSFEENALKVAIPQGLLAMKRSGKFGTDRDLLEHVLLNPAATSAGKSALMLRDTVSLQKLLDLLYRVVTQLERVFEDLIESVGGAHELLENTEPERSRIALLIIAGFFCIASHSEHHKPFDIHSLYALLLNGWEGWLERGGAARLLATVLPASEEHAELVAAAKREAEKMEARVEAAVAPLREKPHIDVAKEALDEMGKTDEWAELLEAAEHAAANSKHRCDTRVDEERATCPLAFPLPEQLALHQQLCHRKRPLTCGYCTRRFMLSSAREIHLQLAHSDRLAEDDEYS